MQVYVVFCESYKLASNCNIQIAKRSQTKRKTAELSLAIPLNKTTESTTLQRIAEEARQKARDASQPLIRPSGKLRPGRPPKVPDSALTPEELERRNRRRDRNRQCAARERQRNAFYQARFAYP